MRSTQRGDLVDRVASPTEPTSGGGCPRAGDAGHVDLEVRTGDGGTSWCGSALGRCASPRRTPGPSTGRGGRQAEADDLALDDRGAETGSNRSPLAGPAAPALPGRTRRGAQQVVGERRRDRGRWWRWRTGEGHGQWRIRPGGVQMWSAAASTGQLSPPAAGPSAGSRQRRRGSVRTSSSPALRRGHDRGEPLGTSSQRCASATPDQKSCSRTKSSKRPRRPCGLGGEAVRRWRHCRCCTNPASRSANGSSRHSADSMSQHRDACAAY